MTGDAAGESRRPHPAGRRRVGSWLAVVLVAAVVFGVFLMRRDRATEWPEIGSLESFQNDPAPAHALCRRLDLPPPPDLAELDHEEVVLVHDALLALRRDAADPAGYQSFAEACMKAGDSVRAAAILTVAVDRVPPNADLLLSLAEALRAHGDNQGAERAYQQACEIDPTRAPAWLGRAELAKQRDEWDTALACVREYLTLEPDDPLGHILAVHVLRAVEESDKAIEHIEQAREALPVLPDLETFLQDQSVGREICRRLDLPELPDISGIDSGGKTQFYGMLNRLRARPHDADQYGWFGQLYEAQKFPDLAVELYRRAIELQPDDFEWHYVLGLRMEAEGRLQEAEHAFARAGELNPDYAPVWMGRARMTEGRDEVDAAIRFVTKYIELRPEDPFGYIERAQLFHTAQDISAMQRDLDMARRLERDGKGRLGRKGHRLLGILYKELDREEDSQFHRQMAAAEPKVIDMEDPIGDRVNRLQTFRNPVPTRFAGLVGVGHYREAVAMSDQVLALHEEGSQEYAEICGMIAECYRQLRDYRNAAVYAVKAVEMLPDRPEPYVELALILVELGHFRAAIEAADEALALDPDRTEARYARGLAQIRAAMKDHVLSPADRPSDPASRLVRAIEDLEACVEQEPVNLSYLVALATAYGLAGEFERADQIASLALRVNPHDPNTRDLKRRAEARESFWPSVRAPATSTAPADAPRPGGSH